MEQRFTPAITLDGCLETIEELARKGRRRASVKLALWAAILSPEQRLDRNGKLTRLLARYVTEPLPDDRDALYQYLRQARARLFHNMIEGLYRVETLEREGKLPAMPGKHWTVAEWDTWRDEVAHIYGMGYKTASFAGLLLRPRECPLVPVDRWVLARLDYTTNKSPSSKPAYMAIERQVREERDRNGHESLPLGAWHWFKWSEARQAAGAEPLAERPESHAALSPRWY